MSSVCLGCAFYFAITHQLQLVRASLVACCVCLSLTTCFEVVIEVDYGGLRNFVVCQVVFVLVGSALAWTLYFHERHLISVMSPGYAVYCIISLALGEAISTNIVVLIIFFLLGVVPVYQHWKNKRDAKALVGDTTTHYNAIWDVVSLAEGAEAAIMSMVELSKPKTGKWPKKIIQHHPDGAPMRIDELYVQAGVVDYLFGQLAVKWAETSNGKAIAAPLKSPERAIAKVARTYKGRPWHLTDICRRTIICDDIAGIECTLRAIVMDSDVEILRMKNRFDPAAPQLSTGYRDLNMNLRIKSAAATALGVHFFVTELQVMLTSFFELKAHAAHEDYEHWRNLMAE